MPEIPSQKAIDAWAYFFRAYKLLRDKVETDLKAAKMPPLSWYDVLWLVYDAPRKRVRRAEIENKLLLPKHNLSRLLDRLAALANVVLPDCRGPVRVTTG